MGITRKVFLFLATFASFTVQAQQHKGFIRGTITTSDGSPAAAVTIHLSGTKISTQSNNDGSFLLRNVAEGTYNVEVSLVGYNPVQQPVTVDAEDTATVDLELQVSSRQLADVIISTSAKKFSKDSSVYVAKMPLKDLENPQVYTTVSKALIDDQLTVRYADALKNVPGVIMQLENNTAGGTVTSRGFSVGSYIRNGVPGIVSNVTIDPINIESIEAIKGPSGTLYGSSLISFGGLFNRVTKKPLDVFQGEVTYTGGGYGLSRFTADINTPLNESKTLLFRLNTALHSEGSYQDAGFNKYFFAAPSLTYKIDDKTTLQVDGEYTTQRANSFYRLFVDASNATGARSPEDVNIDFYRRFIPDDIALKLTQANMFAELNHTFSKHWSSRTNLSYISGTETGNNGYMTMAAGNDSLTRLVSHIAYANTRATDVQENINGDFSIGRMRNRLLLGAEFYTYNIASSTASTAFDKLDASNPGAAYTALTEAALLDRVKSMPYNTTSSLQNTYSAYIQDVLNITPRLIAMASLRWDYFDNRGTTNRVADTAAGAYHQSAFSPKFGLVYQVLPEHLSLFANYMNGFSNNAPVQQPDGTVSTFKPSHANQWEAGVKADMFNGRLSGSVSYYDIDVRDILRPDYPAQPMTTVQDGEQYSKGVEVQLIARPFTGFNIVAGYAYNKSEYEKVSTVLDGYRPSSAGPANMLNFWLSYHLPKGLLRGLGFGFGGNYADKNGVYVDKNDNYYLPSFTVLNAALSYERRRYAFTLKLDNLTNETYYVGWSTTIPQMPRRFSFSVAAKF